MKPLKYPTNKALHVLSGYSRKGRHVVPLSGGRLKWNERGSRTPGPPPRLRLFLGSVTQCVAWLCARTAACLCPHPHPHPPSRPKTKLGPSQTLYALFFITPSFPLPLYHLGHSVLFCFVRLFTHIFRSHSVKAFFFFFFASFNKALVRNPHTDVSLQFPYKHAHNPTQTRQLPTPTPPPPLCGEHVCHLVTMCGLHIKPAA